ncbi:hypothetical protein Y032_0248g99 [Ancylostoma ceylanicum]|uniref:MULE transposase domain-containing protein n=1 Tax=Ancylostoma ceylanicum TaxID=53326 RepID=A0A016SDF5_9BILA|nr:hypothetical protein Y032_0248g99 [Ancylostoma ceylanicum]
MSLNGLEQVSLSLALVSDVSSNSSSSSSQGVRYIAEQAPSRTGKHPVLSYRVPGTDTSYTFTFKRNSTHHDLYQCQQCKSRGKWTGIKVINQEFISDPTCLDHHPDCRPLRTAHNLVERTVYEFYHNIRADASFAGKKVKPLWHQQARIIKEKAAAEGELGPEMIQHHNKKGHISRRDSIRRAVRVHEVREVQATMEWIPNHLQFLWDGSLFVHRLEPTLHVYYNRSTIQVSINPSQICASPRPPKRFTVLLQMAAQNGLHALVADGVHSFQPRQLKRGGQLYTIHGVCSNGVEVPLLYAISSRKTQQVYEIIFRHIRDELPAIPSNLRIVLDFERASIQAVKRVFPTATVQGCAFHLAQAWNRRRDLVGLKGFVHGEDKSLEVVQWWDTIKGLVFLPRRLHREVRALTAPPVPPEHPAYRPCEEFLKYLGETWYDGMFADLWDKFGIEELRTTNLAESYHNQLNTLMEGDHPLLSTLIRVLHDLDGEAQSSLITLQQDPTHTKYLRRRDRERRERIAHEMRSFNASYQEGVVRSEIDEYCRTMSRFVTDSTI